MPLLFPQGFLWEAPQQCHLRHLRKCYEDGRSNHGSQFRCPGPSEEKGPWWRGFCRHTHSRRLPRKLHLPGEAAGRCIEMEWVWRDTPEGQQTIGDQEAPGNLVPAVKSSFSSLVPL